MGWSVRPWRLARAVICMTMLLLAVGCSKPRSSSLKPTDPVFLKQARTIGLPERTFPADAKAGVPLLLYAAVDLDLAHHPETVTTASPADWRVPVLSGGRKIAFYEIENGPHPSVGMVSDNYAFFDVHADAVRRIKKALGPKARCYAIEGGAWFGLIGFEGDRIALTFFGDQGLGVGNPNDPVRAAWLRLNDKDVYVDQKARALLKTLYSKTSPQ